MPRAAGRAARRATQKGSWPAGCSEGICGLIFEAAGDRLRETMMRSWKAAVTFPTEIVEADRWMQQHSTLNGHQLVLFDHHEFVSHSRTFIDHNHFVRAGPAFHGGSVAGGYHGGGGFHGGGGHGGGGHR